MLVRSDALAHEIFSYNVNITELHTGANLTDTPARPKKEPRVRNSQHTPTAIRNISP